jgi:8-amino-7-oxononanoate synthase
VCAVLIGAPEAAVAAAETCLAHGVRVGCFRPPSVPDGISRLRITARADLTPADLDRARAAMAAVAALLNPRA